MPHKKLPIENRNNPNKRTGFLPIRSLAHPNGICKMLCMSAYIPNAIPASVSEDPGY